MGGLLQSAAGGKTHAAESSQSGGVERLSGEREVVARRELHVSDSPAEARLPARRRVVLDEGEDGAHLRTLSQPESAEQALLEEEDVGTVGAIRPIVVERSERALRP